MPCLRRSPTVIGAGDADEGVDVVGQWWPQGTVAVGSDEIPSFDGLPSQDYSHRMGYNVDLLGSGVGDNGFQEPLISWLIRPLILLLAHRLR